MTRGPGRRRAVRLSALCAVALLATPALGLPAAAAAPLAAAKVCEQASRLVSAEEPAAALDLIKQLRSSKATSDACEAVRLRALAQIGEAKHDAATAAQSRPESAASTWQDFQDDYVEPLGKAVLPFLLVFAGLLFLARLAMLLRLPIAEKSSRRERRGFFRAGLIGVLLAAGCTAWVLPSLQGGWLASLGVAVVLVGLVGCLCLARAWSSALRLSITTIALGAESEASSGRIVAMLQQLGADEPRGLEVPRGTDLKVLESVGLTSAPKSAVLGAVFQIAELLVPRSPWYIRVEGTDVDELAVSITRNRRHVASALINRDAMRLRVPAPQAAGSTPPPATSEETGDDSSKSTGPDLHWMAAAFILLTVIDRYEVEEDQGALYGATDWRSVGAHAIATMTRWADPTTARPLLAQAVDWDPDNLAAQVSFWHAMWRESTDVADLDDYCAALLEARRVSDLPPSWSDLSLRISRTLAAASINAYFASGRTPERLSRAEAATHDLLERVRAARRHTRDSARSRPTLAEQMEPSAAAMYLTCHEYGDALWERALAVLGHGDSGAENATATSRWSPSDRYNLACYLAMSPPDELDEAVRHIRVAEHLPGFAGWHLTDPQLKTIADKRAWRTAFGAEPRRDLLAVAPFDKHRDALEAAGLPTAEALARSSAADLSRLLDVDPLVASHMQAFAEVLTLLVPRTPTFALELTCALQQRGLARLPISTSDGMRAAIATELRLRLSPSPRTSDVFDWLS